MQHLKPLVLLPPLLLIAVALGVSFAAPELFLQSMTAANTWVLAHFGLGFVYVVLLAFALALLVVVLPFGRLRLGGPGARPLLSPWSWMAVSLCTNTAVGVLFWAAAEPLYHLTAPPQSLGVVAGSEEAGRFALATLFMHWSFLPCAIYAVPGLMFAFAFYNMNTEFSLAAALAPVLGRRAAGSKGAGLIDALCLYALVAGMAASLATGTLTLAGGLEHLYGLPSTPRVWWWVTLAVVATFIASATTGLRRGIALLSKLNLWVFLGLGAYVLTFGPTGAIVAAGAEAFQAFVATFLETASAQRFAPSDPWPRDWMIFYWAVWLAWAPVTAVFLGRIARGYTVRAFMAVNLLVPALFAVLWMSIYGGTTLHLEMATGLGLSGVLKAKGPEAVIYAVLAQFPGAALVVPVFLLTVFISYVSGADANTSAMAGMCSRRISQKDSEPSHGVKILWGSVIGLVAVVMLQAAGIEGIKMLSNLGGLPALFYVGLVMVALLRVALRPEAFDVHQKALLSAEQDESEPLPAAGQLQGEPR